MTTAVADTSVVRLVVIDDTPDVRTLLRYGLNRDPAFSVVGEAADGRAGVAAALEHQPDVVLLDLAMPVMDGIEALPLVRQAAPAAKVIVLSGFESALMKQTALEHGASAYIQKGTSIPEILRVVAEVAGVAPGGALKHAPPPPAPTPAEQGLDADAELGRIYSALSVAAHELRGPVSVIGAVVDLAQTAPEPMSEAEITELLEIIRRQYRILDQVTADMLITTKDRREDLIVEPAPVVVRPILDIQASVVAAEAPSAEVSVACPADLNAFADEVRLHQMLGNLVSNALKYGMPPLRLEARAVGELVEIRVIDSGDGVPETFRPHLFQRFSRASGRSTSGTGLGLFVVRALAEAQGGTAWYEQHDDGPTFCFAVPAHGGA